MIVWSYLHGPGFSSCLFWSGLGWIRQVKLQVTFVAQYKLGPFRNWVGMSARTQTQVKRGQLVSKIIRSGLCQVGGLEFNKSVDIRSEQGSGQIACILTKPSLSLLLIGLKI